MLGVPVPGVFDGELIAFTEDQPDFLALNDRMLLTRDRSIPIAFVAFDVLSVDGENVMQQPYWQCWELLESLNLVGSHWTTAPAFENGQDYGQSSNGLTRRRRRQATEQPL